MTPEPTQTPQNAPALRVDHPALVCGVGALWLALCVWVVHQGGLAPAEPPDSVKTLVGLVVTLLEALPILAVWWLGAAGYGYALRQRGVAQVGVGMAALLVMNYVAGFVVGFSFWIAWGLCLAGVVLLNVQVLRARRRGSFWKWQSSFPGAWWWLFAVPGVALLIVAACCPPGTMWRVEALGYDVTSYHLQIAREWVASGVAASGGGGMVELQHNVYSYLPGLMEAAYASLMVMPPPGLAPGSAPGSGLGAGGASVGSVYLCQLFHASFVLLAAAAVASWLRDFVGRGPAIVGGAVVLLVPWSIVTGSMAYNEQAVVAFAAVAWRLVAGRPYPCGRTAVAVGLLVGAAALAKLTAGFTVAVPVGFVLLVRLLSTRAGWLGSECSEAERSPQTSTRSTPSDLSPGGSPSLDPSHSTKRLPAKRRRALFPLALCVLVGSATLSPYLARNAAWTGNPVFPFAGEVLGFAHWDETRADRWDAAHHLDRLESPWADRLTAVWRQALGNTGYGAWGGQPTPTESQNIARFKQEGGVPTLWLVALAGLAFGFTQRRTRAFAAVLVFVLLGQFVWWLTMTHLQSRFLIVCIVPLAAGAGLLIEAIARLPGRAGVTGPRLAGGVLAGVLAVVSLTTTWSQSTPLSLLDGRTVPAPMWFVVDSLPEPAGTGRLADLPINQLSPDSKVMVVGNNQSLFYIRPEMVYASAFDESPITEPLRSADDAEQLADHLRHLGVTHLWIGYSELDRLHATYGFDAGVTADRLARLVHPWPHLTPRGATVLVEVPRRDAESAPENAP